MRSNEKFHYWIHHHPQLGPIIDNLEELNLLLSAIEKPIIIIVDGLDHIDRALKTSVTLSIEKTRIKRRTGAPVAVDPVRSQAVKALLEQDVDIVVTDDGLQHYALERDIELVVIDGQRRFGNQYYIPFGPLREGLERLSDVDFLITNGGNAQQGEIAMTLAPSDAVNLKTGERKPVQALK